MPEILRKTLLYMPAGALGPLLQLALIVLLTHWLAPAELGIYAIAVALQDLAQIITLSWWSQYMLRYLEDGQPQTRARQDRTEIAVLTAAGLVQACIVAAAMAVFAGGAAGFALLGSAALAGIARALVGHWSVRARAAEQIGLHAFAQIGAPALTLALTILGFQIFGAGLVQAFLAMALAHALIALPMARKVGYRALVGGADRPLLTAALRYGLFTTVGTGLAWLSMQSVRFVTDLALGAAAVGLLHVGWGVGQRLATQVGVLATAAVFPSAASRARAEGLAAGLSEMRQAGPALAAVLAPAAIGAFAIAEPLAALSVAPEYREATAAILPYAALAGAIRVFRNHYLDEILQLVEEPRRMAALDALEAALTLIFCAVGALTHGLLGAVLGALAAAAVTTAAGWLVVQRRHGPPLQLNRMGGVLLASAAMVAALAALPPTEGAMSAWVTALGAGASYAAVYGWVERRRILELVLGRRPSGSGGVAGRASN